MSKEIKGTDSGNNITLYILPHPASRKNGNGATNDYKIDSFETAIKKGKLYALSASKKTDNEEGRRANLNLAKKYMKYALNCTKCPEKISKAQINEGRIENLLNNYEEGFILFSDAYDEKLKRDPIGIVKVIGNMGISLLGIAAEGQCNVEIIEEAKTYIKFAKCLSESKINKGMPFDEGVETSKINLEAIDGLLNGKKEITLREY